MNRLPIEWQRWIAENLGRGASARVIVDTLVEKGFGAELAAAEVTHISLTGSPYEYDDDRALLNLSSVRREGISVSMTIDKPRIALLANVMSQSECEMLIEMTRPRLKRSATVNSATGNDDVLDQRSSLGGGFDVNENPFIAELEARIARLTGLPVEHGEGLQVLNYKIGGEYLPHFDFNPPHLLGSGELAKGGQRMATLIIYLNSVEEGGETVSPEIGLSVVPALGCAVYFSYMNSRRQLDPMTVHGGNPVRAGEKWIATKWLHERPHV